MQIHSVACLSDNYAYVLVDSANRAVVVDPSEEGPVQAALEELGVTLVGLWLTHHHWDHVGGVEALVARQGDLEVVGSAYDLKENRIPKQTRGLSEGDELSFDGKPVQVIEIPGHTLGAIAFVIDGALFSGDTLFLAGCGRVFEGTMPQMQQSLAKLRALPGDTQIYCGHEYTLSNLQFAAAMEPNSRPIKDRLSWAEAVRKDGDPTVPQPLADELETNPFMRWDATGIVEAAKQRGASSDDPGEVFGALRAAKDSF